MTRVARPADMDPMAPADAVRVCVECGVEVLVYDVGGAWEHRGFPGTILDVYRHCDDPVVAAVRAGTPLQRTTGGREYLIACEGEGCTTAIYAIPERGPNARLCGAHTVAA